MASYKLTKARLQKYLELLEDGYRRGAAARAIGVTPAAIRHHAKLNPDFDDKVNQAEMDACEPIEDAIYTSALEGNLGAQVFWLTNRGAGRWENTQRTKVEQKGEVKFVFVEDSSDGEVSNGG